MMSSQRALNRMIFLNVASADEAEVILDGHTCLIGANNLGKTTLLRAVVFFYFPNNKPAHLGIKSSDKVFSEYYFHSAQPSYLIYEVRTEHGFFHVVAYRKETNRLLFRFVDSPYRRGLYVQQEQFLTEQEVVSQRELLLTEKEVVRRFDAEGINYSDIIPTFELYKKILYGGELAKNEQKLKKYQLLRSSQQYRNIPQVIRDIFMTSNPKFSGDIKADFIKEFVANSILEEFNDKENRFSIDISSIRHELEHFNSRYTDIEHFYRRSNMVKTDLITSNHQRLKELQHEQIQFATQLGSAVRHARGQVDALDPEIAAKEQEIETLAADFESFKKENEEQNDGIKGRRSIFKNEITKAENYLKHWQSTDFQIKIELFEQKEFLKTELQHKKQQHDLLLTEFRDINAKFQSLLAGLNSEEKELELLFSRKGLEVDTKFSAAENQLKNQHAGQKTVARERHDLHAKETATQINELKFALRALELKAQHSENPYLEQLSTLIQEQHQLEHQCKTYMVDIKEKSLEISALIKDADAIEKQAEKEFLQFSQKTQQQLQDFQQQIIDIETKLNLQEKSLYGFLSQHVPEWKENIGKVCREEVLFNRELSPEFAQTAEKTFYGLRLDLQSLEGSAKTLEQYESEKAALEEEKRRLQTELHQFQYKQAVEKQKKMALLGAKRKDADEKTTMLNYQLEQSERKLQELNLTEIELKQKAENKKQEMHATHLLEQKNINQQLQKLGGQQTAQEKAFKEELQKIENKLTEQISALKKEFDAQREKLSAEKSEKLGQIEARIQETKEQKYSLLQGKDIDPDILRKLASEIGTLEKKLQEAEKYGEEVILYRKYKTEYIDQLDHLRAQFDLLGGELQRNNQQITERQLVYQRQKSELERTATQLRQQWEKFRNGLAHYEKAFCRTALYERLKYRIDHAPEQPCEEDITELSTQLLGNENNIQKEFEQLRRVLNEYVGGFNANNHFEFNLSAGADLRECENLAERVCNFIAQRTIEISVAEVNQTQHLLTENYSHLLKKLTGQKSKVEKTIKKIEKDIENSGFVGSRLIEYFKIRLEKTENSILNQLEKIANFVDTNPYRQKSPNLFSAGKENPVNDINKESIGLLSKLREAILATNQLKIRLEDIFEIEFDIKEGVNEKKNVKNLGDIGSEGTTVLIKSCIYISLLHLFLQSSGSVRNFAVHCVIDEVGKLSAPYLKKLMEFAQERGIYLVNGLPNESKLELHYNYTYKLKKEQEKLRILPLLTVAVEVS